METTIQMTIEEWLEKRVKTSSAPETSSLQIEMYTKGPEDERPIWLGITKNDVKALIGLRNKDIGDQYLMRNPDKKNIYWMITMLGNKRVQIEELEVEVEEEAEAEEVDRITTK